MQYFRTIAHLKDWLAENRQKGLTIGFAPTMGALHAGHVSLVEQCHRDQHLCVVSIFVNPTQFNNPQDLLKYPRTLEHDLNMLYDVDTEAVFAPAAEEIYPSDWQGPEIPLDGLDERMEGAFRPGHFKGVVQVMTRLLEVVCPDYLYMGQKDYQQWTIIHKLIQYLRLPIQLIMSPTIREADGLAMSSRNVRLTPDFRARAPIIHQAMQWVRQYQNSYTISQLEMHATHLIGDAGLHPEYITIVDGYSLKPVQNIEEHEKTVVCAAAWAGDVRLIDNLILKE